MVENPTPKLDVAKDLSREVVKGEPVRLAPGQLQLRPTRRGKPPAHLADLTLDERAEAVRDMGLPAFRAKQLSKHYFEHFTTDPDDMTDLPKGDRSALVERFFPTLLTKVSQQSADQGMTQKFLWRLFDGSLVESVLMRYSNRVTLCISSEAGCGMNCPFCATGQMGLTRNLSAAEILEQVRIANLLLSRGEIPGGEGRVTNIVFMGMGEPLANYRAVATTCQRLNAPAPEGFGMGARHITVSTVGLAPAVRKLIKEEIPVTLAVSLHAPDDELRNELVPINQRFDVDDILDAAWEYFEATGRRVSIEYALIRDINDQAERAELLAKRLIARGGAHWVHVNPIPLNPVKGSKWTASDPWVERTFVETLREHGISATIRDTRGSDIDGACGQLAATVVETDARREDREARVARVEEIARGTGA
ncbi:MULTISPECIES: 23S rRNA (adenine(2503)-C(2))-methyltransferase RlmN [Dermabacter]|uniref:Probable dual-specificity RNA methyltransferase RlmN n=1 Tax=Dermabacter hominis 1368 TaxID=1450519 RepID=A0ABR4SMY7_9MICO|nr:MULTISPECIES: 23S rRNA (adenine(2503)-C(2))-methyltransferase RlmN [Dermabacter]KDS94047.1 50S rRNA methyltransferase [Dermabacter hominis 1368]MCT1709476.1 23S rRNA (adenine(2503)-C(2))-methyltransferase RlmN [Dermabacter hominis]MCT1790044.1 23S rRNA (adenine(2503)-C(2))-methyltransferase RlmN [Dermabacter hominis]MCT1955781.1 23S rRNA (adenine(2503)-C(2))-methyltransferase RlmN [Dermabacter hominis]MDK8803171.1 23S rRNA (adenine(2503)-C(2))-methyltransferase RlmN [Dermabacter hominis]